MDLGSASDASSTPLLLRSASGERCSASVGASEQQLVREDPIPARIRREMARFEELDKANTINEGRTRKDQGLRVGDGLKILKGFGA